MAGSFVIDNSVVMAWCFEDETSDYADGVLDGLASATALVPTIWTLEVTNVLLVAERQKRLSRADSGRFVSLLRSLPIRIQGDTADRALGEVMTVARDTGLSSYDASYLELAMREGLHIATLDAAVRRAARKCRVPLLEV